MLKRFCEVQGQPCEEVVVESRIPGEGSDNFNRNCADLFAV